MAAPTPKNDWSRKMRADKDAARKRKPALPSVPEKLDIAREAVNKVDKVNKPRANNAAHQAKWRKANPELNRQRVRDGMRKLREKAT